MVTNLLEIKGNLFMRTGHGSHESLPKVSLDEMMKYTQYARDTKCISVKDTLSRVRTALAYKLLMLGEKNLL